MPPILVEQKELEDEMRRLIREVFTPQGGVPIVSLLSQIQQRFARSSLAIPTELVKSTFSNMIDRGEIVSAGYLESNSPKNEVFRLAEDGSPRE